MPTFTTDRGGAYSVDGRYLTWHTREWDDEPSRDIRLPLRIKLGQMADLADAPVSTPTQMRAVLVAIMPALDEVFDDLDALELADLFETWYATYQQLSGVRLGESLPSVDSSRGTGGQPKPTSARASASRSTR